AIGVATSFRAAHARDHVPHHAHGRARLRGDGHCRLRSRLRGPQLRQGQRAGAHGLHAAVQRAARPARRRERGRGRVDPRHRRSEQAVRAQLPRAAVLAEDERLRRRRPAVRLGAQRLRTGAAGAVHPAQRLDALGPRVVDRARPGQASRRRHHQRLGAGARGALLVRGADAGQGRLRRADLGAAGPGLLRHLRRGRRPQRRRPLAVRRPVLRRHRGRARLLLLLPCEPVRAAALVLDGDVACRQAGGAGQGRPLVGLQPAARPARPVARRRRRPVARRGSGLVRRPARPARQDDRRLGQPALVRLGRHPRLREGAGHPQAGAAARPRARPRRRLPALRSAQDRGAAAQREAGRLRRDPQAGPRRGRDRHPGRRPLRVRVHPEPGVPGDGPRDGPRRLVHDRLDGPLRQGRPLRGSAPADRPLARRRAREGDRSHRRQPVLDVLRLADRHRRLRLRRPAQVRRRPARRPAEALLLPRRRDEQGRTARVGAAAGHRRARRLHRRAARRLGRGC
ncbi:MAG: hypothetical protein AVDCRST_MAG85-1297, partial [uncultured Solirubrobacteraceae bacterium]